MESDRSYFARRAEEERSAADKATNAAARDAHLHIAQSYQQRADAGAAGDPSDRAQTAAVENHDLRLHADGAQ